MRDASLKTVVCSTFIDVNTGGNFPVLDPDVVYKFASTSGLKKVALYTKMA